jgi:hypothetical protein
MMGGQTGDDNDALLDRLDKAMRKEEEKAEKNRQKEKEDD